VETDELARIANDVLGPAAWRVEEMTYESGSPATGGLYRIHATTEAVFVKLLQHVRHWSRLNLVPPDVRESFAASFPWRQELAAWEPRFADCLPAGMRLPELYRITDLGDDRLLLWMEYIDTLADVWDVERFSRAAFLLGGLAARRSTPEILASTGLPAGAGLRGYVAGPVSRSAVPMLHQDDVWLHPLVAEAVDPSLRADLIRLADQLPHFLNRLDALPQAVPHGDASPQNLLVPANAPDEFVAIDISFQWPLAIGFDLGQLLIGLVHAGEMPAAQLPTVHDVLVPSYLAGMKEHGVDASTADVTDGYIGSLVVRAGFTSLPYALLAAPASPDLTATFRQRAALTRFIVDQGLTTMVGR
jgi:hypothetical protein